MNKFLSIILILVTIALGAFAIYEYQQAEHYQAVIAQMRKDAAGAREELDANAAEVRRQKEQIRTMKLAITQLEARNRELANAGPGDAAAAPVDQGKAVVRNLAQIPVSSQIRETTKEQRLVSTSMMYMDLAQELKLAPDEARQMLALLADRQTTSNVTVVQRDGTRTPSFSQEDAAARAAYTDQIKAVLGPDKYAQFQDYEKSMGERMNLNQYQRQLTAVGMPLESSQSEGLFAIMKEERARQREAATAAALAAREKGSLGEINAAVDITQAEYHRRLLERARTVLSPDQILAFEAAQKQQMEMAQRLNSQMRQQTLNGGRK